MTPEAAMRMAIEEGRRGAGFVSPNPMVGCVILDRAGEFLASGFHARVGEGHAEANALASITDPSRLDGAHVLVTLEPCAHEGRTPSCAKALAKLPIAKVTYGLEDPNPRVSGQGAAILRAAGKEVEIFSGLQPELEELAEIFLRNMRHRRPFVALKVAASLDGKIALRDGTSQWITGETSRARVQTLRGEYDAVLTGVGTFLRDNPRLNSRDARFAGKAPRAILLDPDGKSYATLGSSNLLSVRSTDDLIVVTGQGTAAPPVGRHLPVLDFDRDFDLTSLLDELFKLEIASILVEGGPRTASAFLRRGLVDRLYLFLAPKILGDGMSWSSEYQIQHLDASPRLRNFRVENLGGDILITGLLPD